MSKSKKKTAGAKPKTQVGSALEMLTAALDVYERARYGTVAPHDRRKPAADAAASLRRTYEDGAGEIDYGAILLSVLTAARRDGHNPDAVMGLCIGAATEWAALGAEPHDRAPHVIPGTYTAGISDQ